MKKMINFSFLFVIIYGLYTPFVLSYSKEDNKQNKKEKHLKSNESMRKKSDCHEACQDTWLEKQLDIPSLSKYRGQHLLKILDLLGLDINTLKNLDLSEQQIRAIQNIVLCND